MLTTEGHTPQSVLDELSKHTQVELSFGEKLVGITFNPSNNGNVSLIKTKMAELANLLTDIYLNNESSYLSKSVYDAAIISLLEAQMMSVKYVTLKH